jgi:tRNA A37 threonylcarbamoyladenosine biosynthesis protein TsaE
METLGENLVRKILSDSDSSQNKVSPVILLFGELGSGKTTFTKGIARELGITKTIVSPTFTLSRFYSIDKPETDTRTSAIKNIAAETVAAETVVARTAASNNNYTETAALKNNATSGTVTENIAPTTSFDNFSENFREFEKNKANLSIAISKIEKDPSIHPSILNTVEFGIQSYNQNSQITDVVENDAAQTATDINCTGTSVTERDVAQAAAPETVAVETNARKTNVALAAATENVVAETDVARTAATETVAAQRKIRGLLHLDLYRMLDNPAAGDQIEGLGIDEARENGALVVVEWPEPILESLGEYISVRMEVVDEFTRKVEIVSY